MTIPTLSEFPPPPLRSEPETFSAKADPFLAFLPTFQGEINTAIGEMNSTAAAVNQDKTDTESAASTATTKAGEAAASAQSASDDADRAEGAVAALPEGTIDDAVVAPDKAWSSEKVGGEFDLKRDLADTSFQNYDLAVNDTYSANATTDVVIDLSAGPQVVIVGNSSLRTVNLNNPPTDRSMLVIVYATGSAGLSFSDLPSASYWDGGEVPAAGDVWTQHLLWWTGTAWRGSVGMKR